LVRENRSNPGLTYLYIYVYNYAMSRDRRRMLLVEMLRKSPILSQEDLVEALTSAGEGVTQATVSRDLSAIGAVRGGDGYRLPESAGGSITVMGRGDELAGLLRRHLVSVDRAHSIVVVKAAPGHAQMLASAFDRWPPDGVLGTVAGDDTIFLATTGPKMAGQITQELTAMMRGENT